MRPRKQVMLLMRDDVAVSLWRMRLDVAGYCVLSVHTADWAISLLLRRPECRLVIVDEGFVGAVRALRGIPDVAVMLAGGSPGSFEDCEADGFELDGPAIVARVIERVKVLLAQKRGPAPAAIAEARAQRLARAECEGPV